MKRPRRAIRIPSTLIALAFALPGCETLFPGFSLIKPEPPPKLPILVDANEFISATPPADPWLVPLLADRDDLSVNLVRVAGRIDPHLHERSEETVYILQGSGDLLIEREWRSVKAGMMVHIPRNTPHAYINKDPHGTIALSVFTPRFLSGDRIAIPFDPEKPQ